MLEAISIGLGLLTNALVFAYFYGRLSQQVSDHAGRIGRLETKMDRQ